MKQQLQMQQLESEISRLQVELAQVRQMIGSLLRHEQGTWEMAYPQYQSQSQQQQGGGSQGQNQQQQPQISTQFIQDEMRMAPQYQQMQNLGDRLDNQLQQLNNSIGQNNTGMSRDGQRMNPLNNDPMQNQF